MFITYGKYLIKLINNQHQQYQLIPSIILSIINNKLFFVIPMKKQESTLKPESTIKFGSQVAVADKPLFNNLRKLINIVDMLRDIGLQDHISLPRIAVCGDQSAGKSSLLESIVGMDFLPRNAGICTRTPLQLRLVHVDDPTEKPYGIFAEEPGTKYTDFDKVRAKIEELTDKLAGNNKGIVNKPIKLTVYSPEAPDLTLIDLPGITRVALKGTQQQGQDIEALTVGLVAEYCEKDPRTIILAVIPANVDLSTSHALAMAKRWDPTGERTIGVITKIDLMDKGTDAVKVLSNKQIPLKYGYIAVKGRSQEDIINKVKVKSALDEEDKFFKEHKIYGNLTTGVLGTRALSKKLTQVMFKSIRTHLPTISKQIQAKIRECEEKLKSLGDPMPREGKEKIHLLWKLITDFTEQFRAQIKGKFEYSMAQELSSQLSGGALIKMLFHDIYKDMSDPSYKASTGLSDNDINLAIEMHQGDSIPGFPSVYAFMYLLSGPMSRLKEPAFQCLDEVFEHLRLIAATIVQNLFLRFPTVSDDIIQIADCYFLEQKEKTKRMIEGNIDCEMNYLFTNDDSYLRNRTKLIPVREPVNPKKEQKKEDTASTETKETKPAEKQDKKDKDDGGFFGVFSRGKKDEPKPTADPFAEDKAQQSQQPQQSSSKPTQSAPKPGIAMSKEERDKLTKEAKKMFVDELRQRVDAYFRVVVTTLRDIVPKNIGFFLVKQSQDNIQYALYNEIMKRNEMLEQMGEPPEVTQQRQTTKQTLEVLRKAMITIRRDPDFEGGAKEMENENIRQSSIRDSYI